MTSPRHPFPPWLAQRHPTKNNSLRPEQVAANSGRSVWWQCEQGHTWRAPVGRRVQFATGCPYCTGRQGPAGVQRPGVLRASRSAAQWDTERTGSLRPDQATVGSGKRVWWRCEEGHVWKAKVYSRTGKDAHRLPRLRRGRQDQFHPPLPCARGGAE